MRRCLRTAAAAALLFLPSCLAGPHQLRRSVDDWDQYVYVNSPWWSAVLWVVPVFPVCLAGAIVGDFVISDPWHFWFEDAWDGRGTGFEHLPIDWTDGRVGSLLLDRADWTKVHR